MAISTDPIQIILPSLDEKGDEINEDHLPNLSATPCSNCPHTTELTKQRRDAAYYRRMHQKALEREAELKKEIDELKAKLSLRERQLFGKKSEKENKSQSTQSKTNKEKKPRGQQEGSKGHGRRDNSHLPVQEETHDIPEDQKVCPCCGLPTPARSSWPLASSV